MYKKYLTMKDLTDNFGVSRRTIYNWMETEGFPKPVKITRRKLLFDADEIERYLERRVDT